MFNILVKETAEELKIPQATVHRVMRSVFEFVKISLENRESVRLKYLGVFGFKAGRLRHYKRLKLTQTAISVSHLMKNEVDAFLDRGTKHTLLTGVQYIKFMSNPRVVVSEDGLKHTLSFPAHVVEMYSIYEVPEDIAKEYDETPEELGLILGLRYKNGAIGIVKKKQIDVQS